MNRVKAATTTISIFIMISLSSLLFATSISSPKVSANGEYVYYGIVPAKIYQYNLTDANDRYSGWRLNTGSIATASMIAIAAAKDNTQVRVYIQDNNTLVTEAILNNMEKHYLVLPNGTAFKVVTSELACVLLLNYESVPFGNESSGPVPTTFYMATNGAYVGKEFVLMASQHMGMQYVIFALENAEVTVTRQDGDEKTYTLEVNTFKELMWRPFTTYKIESTGNIMIQSGRPTDIWGDARGFFVPSAEGGFVGRLFYSWSTTSWDPRENYGFRVSATQDTKVTIWNLQTKEEMITTDITGGSGFSYQVKAPALVVQSNKPVTVSYIHNGTIDDSLGGAGIYDAYGSAVAYIGVRPNEDTPIYLPQDSYIEAYIFAYENTEVTVGGITRNIGAGSYFLLTQPGTQIIKSNKEVVVQVLSWPFEPETQGVQYDGVQIPCIQTIDVVPDVTLTPLGGGFPMMYVMMGTAGAVAAVVAVFMLRRRRASKPV